MGCERGSGPGTHHSKEDGAESSLDMSKLGVEKGLRIRVISHDRWFWRRLCIREFDVGVAENLSASCREVLAGQKPRRW